MTMPGNMACWEYTQWTGQKGQREEREERLRAGKGARDGNNMKGLGFYGCLFKQCYPSYHLGVPIYGSGLYL